MMTLFGLPHIIMIIVTIIVIAVLMIIIAHVPRMWQDLMLYGAVVICMAGIVFLHMTDYGTTLDPLNLLTQMLQVCNFNLILLPLCLINKNELGRQYLIYFSMFAAMSTFVAYPSNVQNSMWYSTITLTFWFNHSLIVAVPLMMVAARRLKPRKEYIWKVALCLVGYFLMAFLGNLILNNFSFENINYNLSYTMGPSTIMILKPLWNLIPVPFVYLLPLLPIFVLLFYLFALIFKKYKIKEF